MKVQAPVRAAGPAGGAAEVLQRCAELAGATSSPDRLERAYLSAEHATANALVDGWMRQAGMRTWQDAAGNQCGRVEGRQPGLPALLLGSHLDTVPDAGSFDGMLGVVVAVAVVERLRDRAGALPFALEVVGFGDEEGTRFGTALLGSRAVAGTWDEALWALTDRDGQSLAEAFHDFGLDPARVGDAARSAKQLVGYLEAHIEQGPLLQGADVSLGWVSTIAGARRFAITVHGEARHAGGTPWELRRDALVGASEAVTAVERLARASPCVATVGQLTVQPGAVNVIPGRVDFSLDLRGPTARTSPASLETHGARGWLDADGRLVVRTSTQGPFLVRDELARVLGLPQDRVRVVVARVGGGFGGRQELIVEDVVGAAVLALGQPVQLELTREEQFTSVPCRHPMRVSVELGADANGRLTAMAVDVLSDTGAYGNHAPGVLFHGCHESVAVYRCANKRVDAEAVYTHCVPSGAFRGYGLGQVVFAIESAMDELARELGLSPVELRRRNVVVPGDDFVVNGAPAADLGYGSYGLDQCLDLVEAALRRDDGRPPLPDGWCVGEGVALSMIATIPPRGHRAEARLRIDPDGRLTLATGTAEFGNGTATVHLQLVAEELSARPERITLAASDTDRTGHDTGAYGSTGSVVAGAAVATAAGSLREELLALAGGGRLEDDGVRRPDGELVGWARLLDGPLTTTGSCDGSRRSVAFTVQGFRVAVDPSTGEVRILQSVQAVDAGTVINPEQLRGQVEGGVAQGIGSALYEEMVLRDGEVVTRTLRDYRLPQLADVPTTEVLVAQTHDAYGARGAKSMSEAPYVPVAPALANAVRDALGVRPHELPMSRDRLWRLARDAAPPGGRSDRFAHQEDA